MMPEIAVVMAAVKKKSDHQPIFLQAVQEVFEWIEPAVRRHPGTPTTTSWSGSSSRSG